MLRRCRDLELEVQASLAREAELADAGPTFVAAADVPGEEGVSVPGFGGGLLLHEAGKAAGGDGACLRPACCLCRTARLHHCQPMPLCSCIPLAAGSHAGRVRGKEEASMSTAAKPAAGRSERQRAPAAAEQPSAAGCCG